MKALYIILAAAAVAIVVGSILMPEAQAHGCQRCVVCVCAWCRC